MVDFYTSCTNGNRNEYFTEELQNLQPYPNCVSTLPDKTKTTQDSTLRSQSSQYFITHQQESVY